MQARSSKYATHAYLTMLLELSDACSDVVHRTSKVVVLLQRHRNDLAIQPSDVHDDLVVDDNEALH